MTENNPADKQLKDKAVDIKGKAYVQVADRILYLSEKYDKGYSISTDYTFYPEQSMWVVKAILIIGECTYTGLAQETIGDGYINKTSALENCETSAVGRACAMAGIGVIDSIASVDEINKANNKSNAPEWDKEQYDKEEAEVTESLGVCGKCGAPNTVYKKSGKVGCSKLCWKKD